MTSTEPEPTLSTTTYRVPLAVARFSAGAPDGTPRTRIPREPVRSETT